MTDPDSCRAESRAGRKREVAMPRSPPIHVNKRAIAKKKGREAPLSSVGTRDLRRRPGTREKFREDAGVSSVGARDQKAVAADARFRAISRGNGKNNASTDPPKFEPKQISRNGKHNKIVRVDDSLKKRGGSTQAAPVNRGSRTRREPVLIEPVDDGEPFVRLDSTGSTFTAVTGSSESMKSIDPASPNPTHRDIAAAKKVNNSTRPTRAEVLSTSDRFNARPVNAKVRMAKEDVSLGFHHEQSSNNQERSRAATTGMMKMSNAKRGGPNQVEPTKDQWASKVRAATKETKRRGSGILNSILLMSQEVHAVLDPVLQKNTSSQHRDSSSESTPRRDSQELIREYQETVDKLRAKLTVERMGFAAASTKSMKQKEELTAQVNDLTWKLASREKRVNRLEKEMEKIKKIKQNVKVEHEPWETMDCAQFFSHIEIMFFNLEKELEGCKWVVKTLHLGSMNSPRLPSRLELLLEGTRQMTDITEVVIDGLSKWMSSHSEIATKNEELFHHVENKFTKLQSELNQCEGLIVDLAKLTQSSESSNLLHHLNALSNGLNEIATIKNEIFTVSM